MNFNARRTILTSDGSPTLELEGHPETYHSRHGAIQESRHVFIGQGLEVFAAESTGPIRVFELGLGTGLNALLVWEWAETNQRQVIFETVEAFPLLEEEWKSLNFEVRVGNFPEAFEAMHQAAWEQPVALSPHFSLIKKNTSWLDFQSRQDYHLFFFDAFGPQTQPDLWTSLSLSRSVALLAEGGIWVSYCSKGQVRRDLEAAGLRMERLPGPPGKREMLRGVRTRQAPRTNRWNLRCYMLLISRDESRILISEERINALHMTKFPGGGLEFGEGPAGCIQREAIEELGQPVNIEAHFYTTEWFQRSSFRESDQLLSMYYRVSASDESALILNRPLTGGDDGKEEAFRWVTWEALRDEKLTFPIDRWVRELLLRKYAPGLADQNYAPEYS